MFFCESDGLQIVLFFDILGYMDGHIESNNSSASISQAHYFLIVVVLLCVVGVGSYWLGKQSLITTTDAPDESASEITLNPTQKQLVNEKNTVMKTSKSGWHQLNFGNFNLSLPPEFYLTNPRPKNFDNGYAYLFLNYNPADIPDGSTDMSGKSILELRADPGMCTFSTVEEQIRKNNIDDTYYIENFENGIQRFSLPQGYDAIRLELKGLLDGEKKLAYFVKRPDSDQCIVFYLHFDLNENDVIAREIVSTLEFEK